MRRFLTNARAMLGRVAAAVSLTLALHAAPAPQAHAAELATLSSRFYTIRTDLQTKEVRHYAEHMDAVFEEYTRRFASFKARDRRPMPLYLFRTRERYLAHLAQYGINGAASGGMFFVQPQAQGLATFIEDLPRSAAFQTLQHEGFHQFAYAYIGPDLPLWVNEGLAVYFESGVLIRGQLRLGLADPARVESVKRAIRLKQAFGLDELLNITPTQWHQNMIDSDERGELQYNQCWSIVSFLVDADRGKYRPAFEKYLTLVSSGRPSDRAFRQAFGTEELEPLRRLWEAYALQVQSDPVSIAIYRMQFLAEGLLALTEHGETMPKTTDELRWRLQELQFELTRTHHGRTQKLTSMDESLYTYPRPSQPDGKFVLLEPAAQGLPPRITAPGLSPEPTLYWTRTTDGTLQHDVEYR